jgi:hypothetical protein
MTTKELEWGQRASRGASTYQLPLSIAQQATLVHGWTLADVNRAAGIAVSKHRFSGTFDFEDRLDCAWHGVVVELYTRTDPPTFHELLRAGIDELNKEVGSYRRTYGRPDGDGPTTPNFKRYWLPVMRQKHYSDDGFTERLCEHIALRDALSVLTPEQYEALVALAAFDNHAPSAANALGLTLHQFRARVDRGRAAIKVVWFEGETPPARPKKGKNATTCLHGHSRAEYGRQRPSDGAWTCKKCDNASLRRSAQRRRERERGERLVALDAAG